MSGYSEATMSGHREATMSLLRTIMLADGQVAMFGHKALSGNMLVHCLVTKTE